MSDRPDFSNLSCPLPKLDHETVQMAHGAGGRLAAELYHLSEDLVSENLNTLLTLADRVILTKKSWGTRDCGVEALPVPSAHWGERLIDY